MVLLHSLHPGNFIEVASQVQLVVSAAEKSHISFTYGNKVSHIVLENLSPGAIISLIYLNRNLETLTVEIR